MSDVDIAVLAFILGFIGRPYFDIMVLIYKNAKKNVDEN